LREDLARLLPGYMLPMRWLRYDALPRNGNGKVDRPRLRSAFLETTTQDSRAPAAAPATG
jgi:acyl-CoA synthetase (AMP-forming)/AMP-acid ligase II